MVDATHLGLFPVAYFGISGVESSGHISQDKLCYDSLHCLRRNSVYS
jgi:hypothetical protein